MEKIIAIDFGTKKSVIAVIENDIPVIIPNKSGNRITPSIVAFTKEGKTLIGEAALCQTNLNPKNVILSIQSLMGKDYAELIDKIKMFPYEVINTSESDIRVKIRDREYSPIYIASLILQYLRESAEQYIEDKITKAVMTIPVYFNEFQKQAMKEAAKIAGLDELILINQSVIVALLYLFNNTKSEDEVETLFVINFGGSSLNISIVEVSEGVVEEHAIRGDINLGGDDFDQQIIDWMIEKCEKEYHVDLKKYLTFQQIRDIAEKAKVQLSDIEETNIVISLNQSDPTYLNIKLTRTQFEELIDDLLARAIEYCQEVLRETEYKSSDIHKVIIVGGTSRIPIFKKLIKILFGQEPYDDLNSFESPVLGGAIQAGIVEGSIEDMLLMRATPFSLGIEVDDGIMNKIIGRNTIIPTRKSVIVTTNNDMQTSIAIHILQGESAIAKKNWSLGRFDFSNIHPVPKGIPKIEITISVVNDFIEVSAKNLETGSVQKNLITFQKHPIKTASINSHILPTIYFENIEERKQLNSEEEMLQILRKLLEKSDTEETLLDKMTDIVEIKPSLFGVGIDFSKLIKKLFKKKET